MSTLKLISWNVNGIRAALKKGFADFLKKEDPDIICLQETKAHRDQVEVDFPDYIEYWNSAARKGYSGTAIFSKKPALSIINNIVIDGKQIDTLSDKYGDGNNEGRVIAAEYEKFYVVTVYTPNSKGDLTRLPYRHKLWDPIFLKYIKELEKNKPVIFCGDLNVAHKEIDLARPEDNEGEHGFTKEEREGFEKFLDNGFVDTFRMFNQEPHQYSWWTNWGGARARNVGWRIDYVCVSKSLEDNVESGFIRQEVMGSDHAPVGITLKL